MALSEEQNERLILMLQQLDPEIKNMRGAASGFVEDQIKRHDEYGERMFLSGKQQAWLERLYEEHVGPLANLEGVKRADAPRAVREQSEDDDDDSIPF